MGKKIGTIIVIIVVAILVIFGIFYFSSSENKITKISYYTGKVSKEFDNKLISTYKEMKKFTKEISVETVQQNYQNYDVQEIFNEEYFETKKVAVICIYEDDSAYYDYSIDKVEYNEDGTIATIEYTNKMSEYFGTLANSWINCFIIELEGTVTSVNFVEISE